MLTNSPFSQSSEWVEARLGELSIDRKIGQLLSANVHPGGTNGDGPPLMFASTNTREYERFQLLYEHPAGAIR